MTVTMQWERLFTELQEIKTSLAVVTSKQERNEIQIATNTKVLRGGNGDSIGLCAEVESLKEYKKTTSYVGGAVFLAVVVDIVMRVIGTVY